MSQGNATRQHHIAALQSARGIAALIVAVSHSLFLFDIAPRLHLATEALLNAHAAVVFFFVLSGYVLTLLLSRSVPNPRNVLRFFLTRFFRIYPAIWCACTLALVSFTLTHNTVLPDLSPWYASLLHPISRADILDSFVGRSTALLPHLWTVRVEIEASLLMPLIAACVMSSGGRAALLLFGSIVCGAACPPSFLDFVYFPAFVIGAIAFRYRKELGKLCALPSTLAVSLVVLAFLRLSSPEWRFAIGYHAFFPALMESLASAAVVLALANKSSGWICSRALVALGDISYSFYLLHFAVMAALAHVVVRLHTSPATMAMVLAASVVTLSIPISALSYRLIELPGIALGKRMLNGRLRHP